MNTAVFRRRGLFWKVSKQVKWVELNIVRIDGGRGAGIRGGGGISISPFLETKGDLSPNSKRKTAARIETEMKLKEYN